MTFIYLHAFLDRHMMTLLIDPLRADLDITDTEFSLAHGFGFALVLGIASVPAGRLVDRGSRAAILAAAILLWSVMTIATSAAAGFATLIACRAGVALGQATLNPATYALIADRFPPARLGLALGIFGMAPHFGVGFANLAGAAVLSMVPPDGLVLPIVGLLRPWQLVLVIVGAPGLPLALIVARCSRTRARGRAAPDPPPLREVILYFRSNLGAFLLLKLATGGAALAAYATFTWTATLLTRSHGWSAAGAGSALGPLFLAAGATGALCGGVFADWLHRGRRDGRIVAMMSVLLAAAPFAALAPLQREVLMLLGMLGIMMMLTGMAIAINPAATMAMMPPRMRGVATALGVLIVNLIGLGFGPLLVALLTDHLFGNPAALGRALAIVLPMSLAAAGLLAALCRPGYRCTLLRLNALP